MKTCPQCALTHNDHIEECACGQDMREVPVDVAPMQEASTVPVLPQVPRKLNLNAVETIRNCLSVVSWVILLLGFAIAVLAWIGPAGKVQAATIFVQMGLMALTMWTFWAVLTTLCAIEEHLRRRD